MRPYLSAVALLSLAFAQQPGPEEQKKGKLDGSVINALSKEPLRRAEVTLMPVDQGQMGFMGGGPQGPPGTRRATTDQEGKYTFADVEPGRYRLSAQKTGFLQGSYGSRGGFRSMGTQIQVSAGGAVSGAKIELTPQGIIAGRVVDEEGEPIQSVQVMVMREQFKNGRKQMVPMGGNAQSNDRGEFRIANVSPGQVILQIMPARWGGMAGPPIGATDEAPNMAYVTTYYPGATDVAQAAKIEVTPGAELSGFEVKLAKARVSRIRGKVLDSSGQPAKNYSVSLMPKDSMFWGPMGQNFSRAQDGSFELRHVQPGSYMLMVQRMMMGGSSSRGMFHREPITVGAENIDDLVVRLTPPIKVEGQILVKGNTKVDPKTVNVSLMDESGRGWGGVAQQTTNEDGTFVMENVSPGKYRIRAYFMPVESAYVESVQYGDQDASGGKDVEIGGSPSPIRIVINDGAGTATGAVMKDNTPSPGATVVLLTADKSKRDQMSTKMGPTDQNASFSIKGVPPGDYLAFAFEEMEYGFWDDEERFKKIESKAKKVAIQRNGSTSVNLDVTPLPQ